MSWKDIEKNGTWQGIRRVRTLSQLVIDGKKPLQMFCSDAGLGKSETVLETFADNKLKPHYSSPDSIQGLCADLWRHRDSTYFWDDCDRGFRDEKILNLLKMAHGPQRLVVVPLNLRIQKNEDRRLQGDPAYDPDVPPPTFPLGPKHGMLSGANKNYADPNILPAAIRGDFAALISRGLDPLWIPSDPQSVLDYTIWIIVTGMLRRHPQQDHGNRRGGYTLAIQQAVLDFFCTNAQRLTEISPRMAWKLAAAMRDDPDYQAAWAAKLSPHVLHRSLILPDATPQLLSPAMRRALQPAPPAPPDPEPPARPDPEPEPEPPAPPDLEPEPPAAPDPEPEPPAPLSALAPIPGAPFGAPNPPFPGCESSQAAPSFESPAAQPPEPKSRKRGTRKGKAAEQVGPIDREMICQDIAKVFHARIQFVRIIGSSDSLHISAYTDAKSFLVSAVWPPQADMQSADFVLEIVGRHEGQMLTRESSQKRESLAVAVADIPWETIDTPLAEITSQLGMAVKIATHDKLDKIDIGVTDGIISFATTIFRTTTDCRLFWRCDLAWLLRKKFTSLRYDKRGVIAATVPGIVGDYTVYLRGS